MTEPLDIIRDLAERMVERANVEAVIRDALALDRGVLINIGLDGHVTDVIPSPFIPAGQAYICRTPSWLGGAS